MVKRKVGYSHIVNIYKFFSQKMNDVLTVQGAIEYATCLHLEFSSKVKVFHAQPTEFYYEFEGKSCRYTPDFLVLDDAIGKYYIENKFSKRIWDEEFRLRFKAKQLKADELGIPLILVTQKQVQIAPLFENLRLLNRYNKLGGLPSLCKQILEIVEEQGVAPIRQIADLSGEERGLVLAHTLALVGRGMLMTDLFGGDISIDSYVWLENSNREPQQSCELGVFEDEFESLRQLVEQDEKLFELPADIDEPETVERSFETYPDRLRKQAIHRYEFLNAMRKRLVGGWTAKNLVPLIPDVAAELNTEPVSWRTLAGWWRAYREADESLLGLIPKTQDRGNRCNKYGEEEIDIFKQAVTHYLDEKRDSIASTFKYYQGLVFEANKGRSDNRIEGLAYIGFYKRLKKLPLDEVEAARHGRLKAEREFNALGELPPPTRVMECVEIDHTPMDLILLDDELRIPIGRAYLTVVLDTYSHSIVGIYFGYKHPSYYSIMKALLITLKPKSFVQALFPAVQKEWYCYGNIETLVVDNGREFWGENIEQACKFAKFDIRYNKPKHPWLKPMVERFFGTVNSELYSPIPGKSFSNILAKENYDPAKDAVMRFSVFNQVFHQWLIDIYHFEPDKRKTRLPPFHMWQQSVERLPLLPIDEQRIKEIEIGLGYTDKKMHRKGGIHIHNLRYDSDELAKYRCNHVKKINGKLTAEKLLVKTNPDDISSIRVYIDEIKQFLIVPCIDPTGYTKGLSLQKHQRLCELHREFVDSKVDVENLVELRMQIHHRIEEETENLRQYFRRGKVKSMSRLASHQGVASDGGGTVVPEPLPKELVEHVESKGANEVNTDSLPDEEDWDDYLDSLDLYK